MILWGRLYTVFREPFLMFSISFLADFPPSDTQMKTAVNEMFPFFPIARPFLYRRPNFVPRVSHLPAPWIGKMRDPGNEVAAARPQQCYWSPVTD